jgi:hypothetical protein
LWGGLLPLAARWGVDAKRHPREASVHLSPAVIGLQLQVVFLYLSAGMYKLRSSSWREGWHLQNTLERFDYVRPFGRWVGQTFPGLLPPMTWSVLGLQLGFGLMLLLPYRWWRPRLLALAAFTGLQLGMGIMLYVGLFTAVAIVGPLALIPPEFWDRVASCVPALSRSLKAAPSAAAETGIQRACRWGRTSVGLMLAMLLGIVTLNDHGGFLGLNSPLNRIVRQLYITQDWRMFDRPLGTESWFTVEAALSNGRRIDLLRDGEAVSHDRPAGYFGSIRGQHWREMFAKHMQNEKMTALRENYLRWEARSWQRRNPQDVVQSLELVVLSHPLVPPETPIQSKVLASLKL